MADRVVVTDIGRLEAFARQLATFATESNSLASRLGASLSNVRQIWQDPQCEKCATEIEKLMRAIKTFEDAANAQSQYCSRLASRLRGTP